MNDLSNDIQELYCYPVEKHGDRYVESPESTYLSIDRPHFNDLANYISHNHRPILSDVEIDGRAFRTTVYVPNDPNDNSFVVADENGRPPDALQDSELDPVVSQRYYYYIWKKISYSESISPGQASYLETEFMIPSFVDITDSENKSDRVSRSWQEIKNISRLVILGEPGSGKTTCLRKLTLEHIRDKDTASHKLIPIYIQLRNIENIHNLYDEVKNHLSFHTDKTDNYQIETLAQSGQLMLVLDGLDELENETRSRAKSRILDISRQYPQIKVVVSTRMHGYDWRIPGFTHVELEPFSNKKLLEWTYQKLYSRKNESWSSFISLLTSDIDLLKLAQNPLMMSLIVFLYQYRSLLPNRKVDLVGEFVEVLVDSWDTVRGVYRNTEDWASPSRKVEALCRSAFALTMTGKVTFTEREFIAWQNFDSDKPTSRELLQVLVSHTGLVKWDDKLDGENHITFHHRTFVDYFAALYLVQSTKDAEDIVEDNLDKLNWQPVWEYACGITPDASHLLNLMLRNKRLNEINKAVLSAKALSQITSVSNDTLVKTIELIRTTLEMLFYKYSLHSSKDDADTNNTKVWRLKLRVSKSLINDFDDVKHLLESIYNSRSSTFASKLKESLYSSNTPAIVVFSKCLEEDGQLNIIPDLDYLVIEVNKNLIDNFTDK